LPVLATNHTAATTAFALLALRASLGAMIMAHGLNKFFGGGRIPGTARWFESIGMRPGRLNALAAATTEVGCGVLLVAGLLTPIAAGALIAVMAVAIVTVHRKNGYFVFRPGQGIEYCLTIAIAAGVVGALGPGRWSLDRQLGFWHYSRLEGLLIAVLLGVGGAAVQLLAVWRPPKPAATA
jgi:putative oxidoreductase